MAEIRLNPKHVALTFGSFAAIMHVVWSAVVALGLGQLWIDFITGLHFLQRPFLVTGFDFVSFVLLIVVKFLIGAAVGWVFATVWNWVGKKVK